MQRGTFPHNEGISCLVNTPFQWHGRNKQTAKGQKFLLTDPQWNKLGDKLYRGNLGNSGQRVIRDNLFYYQSSHNVCSNLIGKTSVQNSYYFFFL